MSKSVYLKACLTKNLGDDLFVKIITDRYNSKFYSTAIYSYKKEEIPTNLKLYSGFFVRVINKIVKTIFGTQSFLENVVKKNKDVFVFIGGSIFMENNNLDIWKRIIKNYESCNAPIYIIGANFGPYTDDEYLDLIKDKLVPITKDISFRDKYSYGLFKEFKNVRYANDIVYSLNTDNIAIKNDKRVVISVIDCERKVSKQLEDDYEKKIIELCRFFDGKGYEVCLMSFCKFEKDEIAINRIIGKMDERLAKKIDTFFYDGNIDKALNNLARSQIIVGSRFHANILGLVLNKTIIPFAYSDKTINALNDIGFKGTIVDIRKINEFDISSLSDSELSYKHDISNERKEASLHFKELDKVLERK